MTRDDAGPFSGIAQLAVGEPSEAFVVEAYNNSGARSPRSSGKKARLLQTEWTKSYQKPTAQAEQPSLLCPF